MSQWVKVRGRAYERLEVKQYDDKRVIWLLRRVGTNQKGFLIFNPRAATGEATFKTSGHPRPVPFSKLEFYEETL